jgi:type I restriction enzyme S subunit
MSSEWVILPLGQVLSLQRGHDLPSQKRTQGEIPIMGSSGITGFHNVSKADGPGVIVGRSGNSMGEVSFSDKNYWPLNTALYVTDFKGNDPRFIYYLLTTIDFDQFNSGSAQKSLNRNAVYPFEVRLPSSINEQRKISSILATLESKKALNQKINQTLEQMAQAIFKSWFVDFEPVKAKIAALEAGGSEDDALLAAMQAIAGSALFATDAADADAQTQLARLQAEHPEQYATLRATAKLFPSAMQESELGEIPEGWGVNKIEDMIQRVSVGKRYSQKTVFESGKVPVLDQGKSGIIGYHDDEPGLRASTDDPVIVFANHTCYMRLVMHDFSAIQNVLPFKGKELNVYWLYLATFGRQGFTEYKGHWPDFVIKDVVTPSNLVANRFGDIVKKLLITQFRNEQQNASLSGMRDTLLPKLLSGELSISAATDQITQAEEAIDV